MSKYNACPIYPLDCITVHQKVLCIEYGECSYYNRETDECKLIEQAIAFADMSALSPAT